MTTPTRTFFPGSDAIGNPPFYPPVSPDFPELKKKEEAPGSGAGGQSSDKIVRWIDDVAPGTEKTEVRHSEPIAIPLPSKSTITLAVEDQLPKPRVPHNSPAFNGYD